MSSQRVPEQDALIKMNACPLLGVIASTTSGELKFLIYPYGLGMYTVRRRLLRALRKGKLTFRVKEVVRAREMPFICLVAPQPREKQTLYLAAVEGVASLIAALAYPVRR